MRTKTITQLKKDADKWFSKYCRYRDSYIQNGRRVGDCITCGQTVEITEAQAGHFISRRVNSLRYNEENVNLQCLSCNVFRYGEQYKYGLALDLKYGDGIAASLHARRFETHKLTREELEGIIEESKQLIKQWEMEGV